MKRGEESNYTSHSIEDSERFGKMVAALLEPGDILLLNGELGAGKTLLTGSICEALGIPRESVASPTYTILRQYFFEEVSINHWDFYRISSLDELETSDFFELTADRNTITIVEWATLFSEAWNEIVPRCSIEITTGENDGERDFRTKWIIN